MISRNSASKHPKKWLLLLIILPIAGFLVALDNRMLFLMLGLFGALFYAVLSFNKPFLSFSLFIVVASTELLSNIQIVSGISLMVALGIFYVFVWFVQLAAHRITFIAIKEYWILLCLGSVIAISSIVNLGGPAGFRSILTYLQQFLLVILVVNYVTSPEKYRSMGMVLIISSSLIAVPIILAKFGWVSAWSLGIGVSNSDPTNPRMMGFFSDPNFTSAQLLIALPFITEWLTVTKSKRQRALMLVLGGMILLAFAFTFSVGGLVGLLAYFIIRAIWLSTNDRIVSIGKGVLGILIVLFIIFTLFPSAFQRKILDNVDILVNYNKTEEASSFADFGTGRGNAWQNAIRAIAASPWIGHGPGNGSFAIARYTFSEISMDKSSAHNMFLAVASDLGALGLLFFLCLFISALILVRPYQEQTNTSSSLIFMTNKAVFAAITICMVLGLGLNLNFLKVPWILLGMAFASGQLINSTQALQSENHSQREPL